MSIIKITKDYLIRGLLGKAAVPRGLFDLNQYFRQYGPITFENHSEDGVIVAVSTNFRYGSIIAHGRTLDELDKNVKDAILTSFEIPSSYTKEAAVCKQSEQNVVHSYALA